jgi:hypothetical protein
VGDLQSKMALAYSYFRQEVRWPWPFASQHRQRLHRGAQRQHPQPDAGGRWEKSAYVPSCQRYMLTSRPVCFIGKYSLLLIISY